MENTLAHIALAVPSIEEARGLFEILTENKTSNIQLVESQKVHTSFVRIGNTKFELLEPAADETPISNFLEKRGGGIHHVCIETSNFNQMVQQITNTGVRTLGDPFIGASDKRVIFFHPKDTFNILIELEER